MYKVYYMNTVRRTCPDNVESGIGISSTAGFITVLSVEHTTLHNDLIT